MKTRETEREKEREREPLGTFGVSGSLNTERRAVLGHRRWGSQTPTVPWRRWGTRRHNSGNVQSNHFFLNFSFFAKSCNIDLSSPQTAQAPTWSTIQAPCCDLLPAEMGSVSPGRNQYSLPVGRGGRGHEY